jgi:hypothetical protein
MGRENKYETGKYYSRLLIKGCTKRKQIVDYKGRLWQCLLRLQLLMTHTVVVQYRCKVQDQSWLLLRNQTSLGYQCDPTRPVWIGVFSQEFWRKPVPLFGWRQVAFGTEERSFQFQRKGLVPFTKHRKKYIQSELRFRIRPRQKAHWGDKQNSTSSFLDTAVVQMHVIICLRPTVLIIVIQKILLKWY